MDLKDAKIAVIGLGYVGLPLALALAKHFPVQGFDILSSRIRELNEGWDKNRELRQAELRASSCVFTDQPAEIAASNVYIVTVPTPIAADKTPDLTILEAASKMVAGVLKQGDIVVYESTVYPGVTEDICAPILEKESGLKSGKGFYLGYSPERINPGDTKHRVDTITKVVAGQTPAVTDLLAEIYGRVNGGDIFKAKDIKTAEASKAIENAQRDINIAFINEVTMLLNKLGLSSYDVLEAAQTKWNFLPFTPGLVGGHCIGVDPFYLAQAALNVGHEPEVILAGRKINDAMGEYLAGRIDRYLNQARGFDAEGADILLLGFSFKENINDIRNTKVIDTVHALEGFGHRVDVHDPHAIAAEAEVEYGLKLLSSMPKDKKYDCVAVTTAHETYCAMNNQAILSLLKTNDNFKPVIYDIKGIWRSHNFTDDVTYQAL